MKENQNKFKGLGLEELNELLKFAAQNGNIEDIELLLKEAKELNSDQIVSIDRLLYLAISNYQHLMSNYLLDNGADINYEDMQGYTFLNRAVAMAITYKGAIHPVNYFLEKGADPLKLTAIGFSALDFALFYNVDEKILKLIIKNVLENKRVTSDDLADIINNRYYKNFNSLYYAIINANPKKVKLLLEYGAEARNYLNCLEEIKPNIGDTAYRDIKEELGKAVERDKKSRLDKSLLLAAASGDSEKFGISLGSGADIKIKDGNGNNVLHYAAINLQSSLVDYLLSKGADINNTNNSGMTPLHSAFVYNDKSIMTSKFKNEKSFEVKRIEMINRLLDNGIGINIQDYYGKTALCYAVKNGELIVVRELLQKGADLAIADYNSNNVFHVAASSPKEDSLSIITLLLENIEEKQELKWLVNYKNQNGLSPLNLAVISNNKEKVELLLKSGAVVSDMDLSLKDSSPAIIELLKQNQNESQNLGYAAFVDFNKPSSSATLVSSDRVVLNPYLTTDLTRNQNNTNLR